MYEMCHYVWTGLAVLRNASPGILLKRSFLMQISIINMNLMRFQQQISRRRRLLLYSILLVEIARPFRPQSRLFPPIIRLRKFHFFLP